MRHLLVNGCHACSRHPLPNSWSLAVFSSVPQSQGSELIKGTNQFPEVSVSTAPCCRVIYCICVIVNCLNIGWLAASLIVTVVLMLHTFSAPGKESYTIPFLCHACAMSKQIQKLFVCFAFVIFAIFSPSYYSYYSSF